MKTLLSNARKFAATLYAKAGAALTVFLITEPVRARAILTSVVVLGGAVVPALANHNTAAAIAGLGLAALVTASGESARQKVSPVNGE